MSQKKKKKRVRDLKTINREGGRQTKKTLDMIEEKVKTQKIHKKLIKRLRQSKGEVTLEI